MSKMWIASSVVDKGQEITQPSHSWKCKVPRDWTAMTNLVLEYTTFSFMIPVTHSADSYSLYHWDATSRLQMLPRCYYHVTKHQLLVTIQFRIFYLPSSNPNVKFQIRNICDSICFRNCVSLLWHPTEMIRTKGEWEHGTESWGNRREKRLIKQAASC